MVMVGGRVMGELLCRKRIRLGRSAFVNIEYAYNSENINVELPNIEIEDKVEDYFNELKICKIFVKGHIEWAKEVLKKYGE